VPSTIAGVLRLVSVALCLIVVVSFGLFVVHDTSVASAHQQAVLRTGALPGQPLPPGAVPPSTGSHGGSLRHTIDEVAKAITSPFSGITEGFSSQWLIRGVDLALALLVYGFGLGYLARLIRVRQRL
jgi:hypothetical protein